MMFIWLSIPAGCFARVFPNENGIQGGELLHQQLPDCVSILFGSHNSARTSVSSPFINTQLNTLRLPFVFF